METGILPRLHSLSLPRRDSSAEALGSFFGNAKDGSQEVIGTARASHLYDQRSDIRLGSELEGQEGATLSLRHNQFRNNRNPLLVAGNQERVPVREFFGCPHSGLELSEKRRFSLTQLRI